MLIQVSVSSTVGGFIIIIHSFFHKNNLSYHTHFFVTIFLPLSKQQQKNYIGNILFTTATILIHKIIKFKQFFETPLPWMWLCSEQINININFYLWYFCGMR